MKTTSDQIRLLSNTLTEPDTDRVAACYCAGLCHLGGGVRPADPGNGRWWQYCRWYATAAAVCLCGLSFLSSCSVLTSGPAAVQSHAHHQHCRARPSHGGRTTAPVPGKVATSINWKTTRSIRGMKCWAPVRL